MIKGKKLEDSVINFIAGHFGGNPEGIFNGHTT